MTVMTREPTTDKLAGLVADPVLAGQPGAQPPEGRHVDQLDRGQDHDPAERRRRDARQEGVREQQDHQHGGRHGQRVRLGLVADGDRDGRPGPAAADRGPGPIPARS